MSEVSIKHSNERLMLVLLAPQISEKSTFVGEKNNQYVFRVMADATKPEIKAAIELMFKKKVRAVQVANVKGKEKRSGKTIGRRRNWKKAYVSLMPGEEITYQAAE
jgi:large subunit ribosomal protein L23